MLAIACCTSTEVSADSRATGGSLPCVQRINGGRQRSSTAPSAFWSPSLALSIRSTVGASLSRTDSPSRVPAGSSMWSGGFAVMAEAGPEVG